MTDKEIRRKATEAADALMGTCRNLHEDYEEFQDNRVFGEELDIHVAQCELCGWWTDPSEIDDSGHCSDCQEDD